MKAFKLISITLLLLVVLIGGGLYFLFSNLNALVKHAVESEGPKVTQTDVRLDKVALELTKGKGELKGFMIGNPEGFKSDHLFKLDKILLEVDPASVTNDVIVLKNIIIQGVSITAEQKGTSTNIQALLNTLSSGTSGSESEPAKESGGSEKTFMVETLSFTEGSINVITEKFGSKTIAFPKMAVSNLGSKTEGLTTEELGKAVMKPLLKNAKKAVEKAMQSEAKAKLEQKAKDELNKTLENNEGVKDAKDKLKGLFN